MPLTGKDMVKLLLDNGFVERRVNGSHHQLYKDGVRITVPIHGNQEYVNFTHKEFLNESNKIKKQSENKFIDRCFREKRRRISFC